MDDAPIDTNSEEWRFACEVKYVCKMPSKKKRVEYICAVRSKRGDKAADQLMEAVYRAWKLQK